MPGEHVAVQQRVRLLVAGAVRIVRQRRVGTDQAHECAAGATKTLDMTEEGVRHVFLEIGPATVLHPFQILDGPPLPPAPGTMFQRGRLDHFALLAPSEEAFREIRRRIESEGAADGDVRDMKTMWIMAFHDPDNFYVEVIWRKPDVPDEQTLKRAEWSTVELG